MSKDYKKAERKPGSRGSGGSLLVGILIGLVLGLSIALGVAWYINKMPSPFAKSAMPPPRAGAKADARDGPKAGDKLAKAVPEGKPRFDFYKILPGDGQPATEPQVKEAQKASTTGERDAFFLQAGAFQSAPDADSLKARLALIGVEATIQIATLPDKGVIHRVRIGPYANVEALNSVRDVLKQNGYNTALIKVPDGQR